MNILIQNIPKEGLRLNFSAKADPWFSQVLSDALDPFYNREDGLAQAKVECTLTNKNVSIDGQLKYTSRSDCSRCGVSFEGEHSLQFHTLLSPVIFDPHYSKVVKGKEVPLVKDDLEFSFYEGNSFNLADIMREQIILDQPIQSFCIPDCKGLCPQCGGNLNKEDCNCHQEKKTQTPWKSLAQIDIKSDK